MSRPQAAARLRRVLAMIPWIAQHQDATVAELARAFGVPERVVTQDLELLPFCGLPPYTPDRLIDVAIVEGSVSVRFAEYFSRPLRLTPAEGFALLAAGRTLLAVPGSDPDGPLASALSKLEGALHARDVLEVDVGEPDFLDRFRRACEARSRLEIDYYSFSRDALGTRRVDPLRVLHLRGHWYVGAYCHQAGDERLFRIDRVRAVRETGEHFEARPAADPPGDAFQPTPAHLRVTLDLPSGAAWVPEAYPTESVEVRRDGRLRVTLAVGAQAWLERLLLQIGPEATVVAPRHLRDAAASAARRVLARYERA